MNFADLVEETTTVTSTAAIALLGASAGYRTFALEYALNTADIPVCVKDAAGNYEIGLYTLSAAQVLTRNAITKSSNANNAVAFGAGTKTVGVVLSAGQIGKLHATDATEVTTIADAAAAYLAVTIGGVARKISAANFLTTLGQTIAQLDPAGAIVGTDRLPISQSGVEKYGTMTAIAAAVASLLGLTDNTAPNVSSAVVSNAAPTVVVLQMSETLNAGFIPAASAFTVSGHTVSSVAIAGSTISLTCSAAFIYGETPRTVAYTQPGTNNARDSAGNLLANFAGTAITNNVASADVTAPTFVSAAIANASPTVIDITMSEALAASVPASTAFAASGKTITGVSVAGSVISVTVSVAYAFGDTPTITYTQPGANRIQDAAGNPSASFGPSTVTNNIGATDTVPPSFVSAQVANAAPTQIVITMSETLGAFTPAAAAFTLSGGKTCTNVARSGATLTLTASAAYAYGDVITASYVKPGTNQLRDVANNETASFGPVAVTNNIASTAPAAAVTSLAAGAKADTTIELTWVNATGGTGWTVKQRTTAGGGAYTTSTLSVAATATGCTVSGLAANTAYDFEVTVFNGGGNGPAATLGNISTTAALVAWTNSAYSGTSFKATADGTTASSVQGTLKGYLAAKWLNGGTYWATTPKPATCKGGWGTSATVPPAEITIGQNQAGSASVNGMQPLGAATGNNWNIELYCWLTGGSGSTTMYYWMKPVDGAAQCLTPSGVIFTNV